MVSFSTRKFKYLYGALHYFYFSKFSAEFRNISSYDFWSLENRGDAFPFPTIFCLSNHFDLVLTMSLLWIGLSFPSVTTIFCNQKDGMGHHIVAVIPENNDLWVHLTMML